MPLISVFFEFSQKFDHSAAEVYRWATDYGPRDLELMGQRGRRRVARVCNDTLILADTYFKEDGGRVSKRRLVKLYPERLAWTNTHLSGPNRHSQFFYELVSEGPRRSRLDFTGQQVVSVASITPRGVRALARRIAKQDAGTWRRLARALEADLKRA